VTHPVYRETRGYTDLQMETNEGESHEYRAVETADVYSDAARERERERERKR